MKSKSAGENIVFCALLSAALLSGCAMITEGAKGFAGVSTKALEDARPKAISADFAGDYDTCLRLTKDALKKIKAYVYADSGRKQMLAVYVSESDTTPVGIFFVKADAGHTRIEVSSLSTYAKEYISKQIFQMIQNQFTPAPIPAAKSQEPAAEKKEEPNAQK